MLPPFDRDAVKQFAFAGTAAVFAASMAGTAATNRLLEARRRRWLEQQTDAAESANIRLTLIEQLRSVNMEDPACFAEIAQAVTCAVNLRDSYTGSHCLRVAQYSFAVGRQLRLATQELDRIRLAALLHDIGKLGVRSYLLNKAGWLSTEERREMREHTRHGAEMVRASPNLLELLPGVELHHENWDGSGYPYGISRQNVPLMARVIAVADAYDAMTSERPYQSALGSQRAAERIRLLTGHRFCPLVADAFSAAYTRGTLDPVSAHDAVPSAQGLAFAPLA